MAKRIGARPPGIAQPDRRHGCRGGFTGLAGFIGYSQPNLFGLAKTGSFRWIFGRRQQDIDLTYSDPEILGSRYSGTITLRNSRDQFTGFSLGADLTLPASMQADVVDLDTLRSGRQRTGTYFAIWGVATKLALALAAGIAFPLLELAGFNPESEGKTGLFALAALYSLLPAAFKIGAVALFWGYPITAERQRRIRRMIRSRYAGA